MMKAASLVLVLSVGLLMLGCGSSDSEGSLKATAPPVDDPPLIEEPDLYRLLGGYLYVQNPQTGLNILDVGNSHKPRLVGRAAVTGGAGAEMYLQGDLAVVMLKTATGQCHSPDKLDPAGWSLNAEVVLVDVSQKTHPKIQERYCLPGSLVASRTVGQMLFVVTMQEGKGSRAISINIAAPTHAVVVQQKEFPDATKEIIITADTLYVAGSVFDQYERTRLGAISIDKDGSLTPRGTIDIKGRPMGRFHMDVTGTQFRIVTYNSSKRESLLSVVEMKDLDTPVLLGQLASIGKWEQLHATRFVGDRAYVVTYRQSDPLWVISLANPKQPKIVGELHVPGYSDFLFVRGTNLIAVGRGDNGLHLGVSLFDVSDPTAPRSLSQLSLGGAYAASEANVDFRAVTILDMPGGNPLIVVPMTTLDYAGTCEATDRLLLVEQNLAQSTLKQRGSVEQQGTIRRSLIWNGQLLSISDYEVLSVDVTNLDNPRVETQVTIGNTPTSSDDYSQYCGYGMDMVDDAHAFPFFCALGSAEGVPVPPLSVLLGLAILASRLRRRRR